MATLKISKGGQVSVPAAVRHRWRTDKVIADDRGDHLIIRPAPGDPIAAAKGALKGKLGMTTDEMRRQIRREEAEIEERKYGRLAPG